MVEPALGLQDEVDEIATGAMAAGAGRNPVGFGFDLLAGVPGGNGEADLAHGREIDNIVAGVGDLVERDAFGGGDGSKRFRFEVRSLKDMIDLEVAHTYGHGVGFSLGNDAEAQSGGTADADTEPIVR